MAARRSGAIVAVGALLAILIGAGLVISAIRPAIEIRNAGRLPVSRITVALFANGGQWSETIDELGPGQSVRFRKRTSDLYVRSIGFQLDGREYRWNQEGLATPGEVFRLRVGDDGTVVGSYIE